MSTTLDYQSGVQARAQEGPKIIRNWWGWAVYLGMSWTWCIGMFLPVLLVRDYGLWGWIVFAIPNVIGAAAMGWILRDATSEAIVDQHRLALTTFSFVTATFQIFFAAWVFTWLEGPGTGWLVILSLLIFVLTHARLGAALLISLVVLILSLGTIVFVVRADSLFGAGWLQLPSFALADHHLPPTIDILALSTVSIFGFLLCPYLDPTFHIARQKSEAPARSFTVGFGCFFFLMILFSLAYASKLIHLAPLMPGWYHVLKWISWYWTAQLALTAGLQWSATPTVDELERRLGSQMPVIIGSIALAVLLSFLLPYIHYQKMNSGELIYRCLLGFYGLVFPAYVWLCMLPGRWIAPPTKQQWILLAVAVTVATPMFWMAFIERKMIWVVPGVAVPLAARAFVGRRSPVQQ